VPATLFTIIIVVPVIVTKREEFMRFLTLFVAGAAAWLALANPISIRPAAAAADAETCDKDKGDEAIAACTRVIENPSTTPSNRVIAYYNRGYEYDEKEDYDRAIADYDEAIKIDRKFFKAYFNRAIAYNAKGDTGRAIADFSEVIRLDPSNARAYHNRGILKKGAGDSAGGSADIARAKELNPDVK
jgi:tetratricopeptide (TPR) repeat protein